MGDGPSGTSTVMEDFFLGKDRRPLTRAHDLRPIPIFEKSSELQDLFEFYLLEAGKFIGLRGLKRQKFRKGRLLHHSYEFLRIYAHVIAFDSAREGEGCYYGHYGQRCDEFR